MVCRSEHPELLSWHFLDNNLTILVDTARVSQNFQRLNASFAQPVSGSGDIEISTAIFFCASTLQRPAANRSGAFQLPAPPAPHLQVPTLDKVKPELHVPTR